MSHVETLAHDVDQEEKHWVELIDRAHRVERISHVASTAMGLWQVIFHLDEPQVLQNYMNLVYR